MMTKRKKILSIEREGDMSKLFRKLPKKRKKINIKALKNNIYRSLVNRSITLNRDSTTNSTTLNLNSSINEYFNKKDDLIGSRSGKPRIKKVMRKHLVSS
mmetsp:Transcript_22724/g.20207  ORF Transcript_22724/g.20207 Transcript_22724/m.20207 type:complete len:100 (+) Transcript_22724:383-682(+)